ncbi:MAG: hypothetical protein MPN21_18010 [Thermoanaerobaculia bacterium]|nr:hypothetical protein [Thermoanaerobaculia bacterium]
MTTSNPRDEKRQPDDGKTAVQWSDLRASWQSAHDPEAEAVAASPPARVQMLRRKIVFRDLLETVVAILIAPAFVWVSWLAWKKQEWWIFGFGAFLTATVIYVPWRLWRERRKLPKSDPERPVMEYLRKEREGMRAQAELLESIWSWYLGPIGVGVIGLFVSIRGFVWLSLVYSVTVALFYFAIGKANLVAARRQYRVAMKELDEQLAQLEDGQPRDLNNNDHDGI